MTTLYPSKEEIERRETEIRALVNELTKQRNAISDALKRLEEERTALIIIKRLLET